MICCFLSVAIKQSVCCENPLSSFVLLSLNDRWFFCSCCCLYGSAKRLLAIIKTNVLEAIATLLCAYHSFVCRTKANINNTRKFHWINEATHSNECERLAFSVYLFIYFTFSNSLVPILSTLTSVAIGECSKPSLQR